MKRWPLFRFFSFPPLSMHRTSASTFRISAFFSLLLLFLGVSSLVYPAPAELALANNQVIEDYRIGVNDLIEVVVYEEPDLSAKLRVSGGGEITYPLLGRFNVLGMTVNEVEDLIRTKLSDEYIRNPQVRVSVQEFSNVIIYGQVNKPGMLDFKAGMTVLQAISKAGGFTPIASKGRVTVVRDVGEKEKQVIKVNLNHIAKGDDEDVLLKPGDTIVVPESFF
ncbi:MAG: polysaccharide export protein [Candidatus Omnitrophica bacterium]|nr:polysaccharide export protein [Candidatus Omnitrophota bacterium]